ncbi:MAG TPA: class I SAM-dependent methyltransferase [Candidatus Binatia bacterium]|jgi:2-polyprenyl-3-methyl-5-hydroxy-6-metoxy-1,4-benzoquinol methylase|nr:class I SAM-dependent methyltransferase [Candidatus Binatia bacterium]
MQTRYVNCSLCGRDDWQVRFPETLNGSDALDLGAFRCTSSSYGQHPQIVQCRSCGYVYANPRWVSSELFEAYVAVQDETYVRERAGRELTFRRHLQSLHRFTGAPEGRRLLDVGAYIGVFVEVASAAGWRACGVEPSQWAVSVAQRRGLPVVQGTLESLGAEQGTLDVVTMWDVIEHVDDPPAELAQAYRLLKPGGVIAVHTMDVESLFARLMGRRWPWLMDMHIHYFSPRTLSQMLQKEGFEVLESGPQGRYLRLGYLASRLQGLNATAGGWLRQLIARAGLEKVAIPVNFGDLFTVFARRK